MTIGLIEVRDRLIYILWRRANKLRTAELVREIKIEFSQVLPITDDEIKEARQRLIDMGIDADNLRSSDDLAE